MEVKRYKYLPSEEGWERMEYEKVCSKCFEEVYHYWIQFEKGVARRFDSEPAGWKKLDTIHKGGDDEIHL